MLARPPKKKLEKRRKNNTIKNGQTQKDSTLLIDVPNLKKPKRVRNKVKKLEQPLH